MVNFCFKIYLKNARLLLVFPSFQLKLSLFSQVLPVLRPPPVHGRPPPARGGAPAAPREGNTLPAGAGLDWAVPASKTTEEGHAVPGGVCNNFLKK